MGSQAGDTGLQQMLCIQVIMVLMAFSPRATASPKEKSVNIPESNHLHHHQPMDRIRLLEGPFGDLIIRKFYIKKLKLLSRILFLVSFFVCCAGV